MLLTTTLETLQARGLLTMLDAVCQRRRVTRDEICSRCRTRTVAHARHELWWQLRSDPRLRFSYQEIGLLFGRTHSSVLHGIRAFERQRARSAQRVTAHDFCHSSTASRVTGPPCPR